MVPPVGGGFAAAGPVGEYFVASDLTGTAAFTRKDVRIDFEWGSRGKPGGSIAPGYRDVGAGSFSVRWTGQVIPRFSETYTFKVTSVGGARLFIRPAGSGDWTTLVDHWDAHAISDDVGAYAMTTGVACDLKLEYRAVGPAAIRLAWSSPSISEEIVDTVAQIGLNISDWTAAHTDIVKGARNSWWLAVGGVDVSGWPKGNCEYIFQESLNQGLDVDPLMRGTIAFSFKGKADVSIRGNVGYDQVYTYNTTTNITTGTFTTQQGVGSNASYFNLTNATRDGQPSNGTNGGITDLKLMRPTAPDATTSYSSDSTFTSQIRDAYSHFTLVRFQTIGSQERDWSERTLPAFFNQSGGAQTPAHYNYPGTTWPIGSSDNNPTGLTDNGPSWEYKVMLCNETGRDLMISIPPSASGRTAADVDSYVYKLAQLIRYGSDGVNPYASPQADPVYPPLNPNLRVYFEIGNELWNWAGPFYTDFSNVNAIVTAAADAYVQGHTDDPAYVDFQAINYDGASLNKDANGVYVSLSGWRNRQVILRVMQMSNVFRAVFGDSAMMSRIRPLYEWQYNNMNGTASWALSFADWYFNNGDGVQHVATPHPVSYYLWGGGGATYYGAINSYGLTDLIPSTSVAGFEAVSLPVGYNQAPTGTGWTFTGTAGIAHDGGSSDDIPTPYDGTQVGYITDTGSISIDVTFPSNPTSNVYAVSFKAVNRTRAGGNVDLENLRVYLDGTTDITAPTASQGYGYTPPGQSYAGPAWLAQNVFWVASGYYYTKVFTVASNSTHQITISGQGDITNPTNVGQTVFLEDVRITSVDKIFVDGFPGGGEATGQPSGQNYQAMMNGESTWARTFGLGMLSYEGGWSLGGDDGGSALQLNAKYGDTRTVDVQSHTIDMFYKSGAAVSVLGTYIQWPSWSDYYAQQGLINVAQYPIIQGVDASLSHLAAKATNGTLLPALLLPSLVAVSYGADGSGGLTVPGGYMSWMILASRPDTYTFTLISQGAGSNINLVVDDQTVASGPAGVDLSGTITLSIGLHAIRVCRSSPVACGVSQVAIIRGTTTLTSPALNLITAGGGSASLSWNATSGATGYTVRYGTFTDTYLSSIDVGDVTSTTVTGLTNGCRYYFAVSAYDAGGEAVPGAEQNALILDGGPPATPATIWDASEVPGTSAADDQGAVEVGVKFRSDIIGHITGIRFYKGISNTGTHVGNLWSSTGTNLATATFTDETASGWQQANFTGSTLIQANTTYIASYTAPNGNYAADIGYFTGSGVDNGTLHALKNGVDGNNGVFGGPGYFPSNSYKATNYWVDVVFGNVVLGSPISIWSATAVPANLGIPDSPVELGVKFRSDVAGYITSIRFYKSVNNTGTHVGNLWNIYGTSLATITFADETESGWQQADFASPVMIQANTTYIASYHTVVGYYCYDSGYFSTNGADNVPLHALMDGVDGHNGLFGYGSAGTFPASFYGAANYWVDVVFVPIY